MRFTLILGLAAASALSVAQGVTVSFSTGSSFTLFQTSSGNELDGGFIHAGYYPTSPIGLGSLDLRDNFITFGTLAGASNASGFFADGSFPDAPLDGAAGQALYLVVTDTATVGAATELAVFTNTEDSDWAFPSSELAFGPGPSVEDITPGTSGALLLAGTETTSTLTGGGPAIGLSAVPEPSTALLGLLGVLGLLRRRR